LDRLSEQGTGHPGGDEDKVGEDIMKIGLIDVYVMVYDKPNAPAIIKRLQRWVNNKKIFGLCRKFEDYQ
jgi:hypothetical protein